MQVVKKIAIALCVIWFALVLFMPKAELYYTLEKELAKNEIKINEERIEEGLFSLTLQQATLYFKGINLGSVKKVTFFTLLFYTKVELQDLLLDDSLKSMTPTKIDKVALSHIVWFPMDVQINIEGIFTEIRGNIDLSQRKLHLDLNDTKELEVLEPKLQKDEKGWYYETSF